MRHGYVQIEPKKCKPDHFDPFSLPLTYSKVIYTTNEVHLIAYNLPKVSTNQYYQKMYSFLTSTAWKCTKCAQKSYIWSFWPTFEYNPLKSSLHSSEVHLRAHVHPKDSHKLVLPDYVFISNFGDMEMSKMYPKIVYLVILSLFLHPLPLTYSNAI